MAGLVVLILAAVVFWVVWRRLAAFWISKGHGIVVSRLAGGFAGLFAAVALLVVAALLFGPEESTKTPDIAQAENTAEPAPAQQPSLATAQPLDVPPVNDETVDAFIRQFADDYITQFYSLMAGYELSKPNRDYQGFHSFRQTWLPGYEQKRAYYGAVLEKSRVYLMEAGLIGLLAGFDDIALSQLDLWTYLRSGDEGKVDIVNKRHQETLERLAKLDKERGLKLKLPNSH
jgi:hypothetical protein